MPKLAPKYVTLLAKRYVINHVSPAGLGIQQTKVISPDVPVAKPSTVRDAALAYGEATLDPTVELISPFDEQVPISSIEVRDVASRSLVTDIEILSPVNKHGQGARDYNARRAELLKTCVHLLELDLLRGGERIELIGDLPPGDYFAFLSRVQRRPVTSVYAMPLRKRLHALPVPLLLPDPDVVLDLQAAVDACFALVGYERLLDYTAPPPPELSVEDQAWAKTLIEAFSRE